MNKVFRSGVAICLCLMLLLSGCTGRTAPSSPEGEGEPPVTSDGWEAPEPSSVSETLEITDDLGRTVVVPRQPQRVAALIGSFASVWILSGGTLVAAADDAWDDFDLNLPDDVVNLGSTKELSLEQLFASEPELVIASTNTQLDLDWKEPLERAGIPTLYFDVSSFGDYLRMLDICTQITGRADLYQQNGLDVREQIDGVIAGSQRALSELASAPTVLYLRATAVSVKAKGSEGTVLGEMLADLGCVNIADGSSLLEELSLEAILQSDPDYIFIVEQGNDTGAIEQNLDELLRENPAWAGLTAVREGRLYYLDGRLYNLKPNDRWGEAYEQLAEILFD